MKGALKVIAALVPLAAAVFIINQEMKPNYSEPYNSPVACYTERGDNYLNYWIEHEGNKVFFMREVYGKSEWMMRINDYPDKSVVEARTGPEIRRGTYAAINGAPSRGRVGINNPEIFDNGSLAVVINGEMYELRFSGTPGLDESLIELIRRDMKRSYGARIFGVMDDGGLGVDTMIVYTLEGVGVYDKHEARYAPCSLQADAIFNP